MPCMSLLMLDDVLGLDDVFALEDIEPLLEPLVWAIAAGDSASAIAAAIRVWESFMFDSLLDG